MYSDSSRSSPAAGGKDRTPEPALQADPPDPPSLPDHTDTIIDNKGGHNAPNCLTVPLTAAMTAAAAAARDVQPIRPSDQYLSNHTEEDNNEPKAAKKTQAKGKAAKIPNAYNAFVKMHLDDDTFKPHLNPCDKFKAIIAAWNHHAKACASIWMPVATSHEHSSSRLPAGQSLRGSFRFF